MIETKMTYLPTSVISFTGSSWVPFYWSWGSGVRARLTGRPTPRLCLVSEHNEPGLTPSQRGFHLEYRRHHP
jgi:hypothetical protein